MSRIVVMGGLALPMLGCEVGLIVAAINDEPAPDYHEPIEETYCDEYSTSLMFSGTMPGSRDRRPSKP